MEEEIEESIKKALSKIDPSFSITEIRPAKAVVEFAGRYGGKSEILRVKGDRQDSSDEYTVKKYIESAKSIGGICPALRGYYTEKAVLKTIPDQPQTYLKALYYDDEGLFLIFPKIANSTLEERIHHAPISSLLEKSMEPVKNWHGLSHPDSKENNEIIPPPKYSDFRINLEKNLSEFSNGRFTQLREPSRKDYFRDLKRYMTILNEARLRIQPHQKQKIVNGLTLEKFMGPNTHDGYPWHNLGEGNYLIDSGDVNICSFALHLGCLIGHHSIYHKIGNVGAEHLINRFSKDPDLKKAFYSCAVYANLRELAGALTVKKTKLHNQTILEYLTAGLECINDQLRRM
ncbi:MAG: hypothetical protein KKE23_01150 [Nanoarchaeota archaeon]|nr:hypothetical protein [Nanoarchaeota archaeon]